LEAVYTVLEVDVKPTSFDAAFCYEQNLKIQSNKCQ